MTHNRLPYDAPPAPVSLLRRVARLSLLYAGILVMLAVSVYVGACAAKKGWGP